MRYFVIIVLLFLSNQIFAHSSHGSGIIAGLSHPIMGLDHLLAILGMSLYAKINYPSNAWIINFAFVGMMIVGGIVGMSLGALGIAEYIILLSVIFYGMLLGVNTTIRIKLFFAISLIFSFFHGYAHGVEIPDSTTPLEYVTGYTIGAIIISAFGEFIGRHMASDNIKIARFIGGLLVGLGIMILLKG